MTFTDGGATLGTAQVGADGTATFTTTGLAVGAHTLSASYAGDADNLAGDSAAVDLTVTAPAPPVEPTQPAQQGGSGSSSSPPTVTPPPTAPTAPKVKVAWIVKRPPAAKPGQGYRYTFRFSDATAGSTFYCRLGSAPFKRCKSPIVYPHLGTGHHFFTVKAVAPNGEATARTVRFVAGGKGS